MKKSLTFIALFIAVSSLAFSQISFEKIWEVPISPEYPKNPCFSTDGKYIYAAGEYTLMKFDASTGQFIKYLDKSTFPKLYKTINMAQSPKGTYLLSHDGSTGLYLWDTKTEKAVRFIYQTGAGLVMTPDERYHIYEIAESYIPNTPPASENSNIYIYDLQLDSIIKKIPAWGHNSLLALSSDGKYLATVAYKNESKSVSPDSVKPRQKVLLWDTETWIPEVIDDINKDNGARLEAGFNLIFSPDNKYLAWTYPYKSWDHGRAKIYDIHKRIIVSISDSIRNCFNVIFLPDSSTYGFNYPKIEFYDLATNQTRGILDYPIYQWSSYSQNRYFLGYGDGYSILFRIKDLYSIDKFENNIFTVRYNDNILEVIFNDTKPYTPKISIFDINGKEIFKSSEQRKSDNIFSFSIDLSSGFYLINLEIDSKKYFTKLEVTR